MDKELVGFVIGNLAIFAAFTWIFVHYRAKRQERMAEDRLRFLERFESAQEVAAFLESPSGQRVLDSLGSPRSDPRRAILGALPFGFVSLIIGLGMAMAILLRSIDDELSLVAVIFTGAGIGILVSVVLSQRLARSWGMIESTGDVDRSHRRQRPGTRADENDVRDHD